MTDITEQRPYHHGNLRRALMDQALQVIAERGPAGLSLRELSRRLGVSHAAPVHHFEDKAALLTAIAAEGYGLLAEALEAARGDGFLEAGLAYVRFMLEHEAHVTVMFQPSLYREDDPELQAAQERATARLHGSAEGIETPGSQRETAVAGWCLMHGFASLWLTGNLRNFGDDPIEAARSIARTAFRPSGESSAPARGST